MDVGLYSAVGAMRGSLRSLDVLAHNLANVGTHGYKRRNPGFHQVFAHTDHGVTRTLATRGSVDLSQGGLDRTGDPFQLALNGEGYLAVEAPEGEVYTRVGRLAFDRDGTLVTVDGYPMAWAEQSSRFDPSGAAPVIDADGTVYQGLVKVGRLKLTAFADPSRLTERNGNYWEAPAQLERVPADARVVQGALERSNSTGVVELIDLLENQRSYEIASRAVTSIDQSYKRLNQGRS